MLMSWENFLCLCCDFLYSFFFFCIFLCRGFCISTLQGHRTRASPEQWEDQYWLMALYKVLYIRTWVPVWRCRPVNDLMTGLYRPEWLRSERQSFAWQWKKTPWSSSPAWQTSQAHPERQPSHISSAFVMAGTGWCFSCLFRPWRYNFLAQWNISFKIYIWSQAAQLRKLKRWNTLCYISSGHFSISCYL